MILTYYIQPIIINLHPTLVNEGKEKFMYEKTLEKRLDNMEKIIYENIFLKNTDINEVLKQGLEKHIKSILFASIRFTLMHNCLIRAIEEKLYKYDLEKINRNITKICLHLDEILKITTEIIAIKK